MSCLRRMVNKAYLIGVQGQGPAGALGVSPRYLFPPPREGGLGVCPSGQVSSWQGIDFWTELRDQDTSSLLAEIDFKLSNLRGKADGVD